MSAEVIQFKQPAPAKPQIPMTPRWYCVGCGSRHFVILATGDIYCAKCERGVATIRAERT